MPKERVSTGIARLDAMFDGKGFYTGSSVLVSGTAGTGKTTLAAHFAEAACKKNKRCLYFAFEESPQQITRNMASVGIDLRPWLQKKLLLIRSTRPTFYGLEMHLLEMTRLIHTFSPEVVVIDPITNLITVGLAVDVKSTLTRLVDYLKSRQITTLFTSLTSESGVEHTETGVSSLMDTWIVLKMMERDRERTRGLTIIKSRGMAHANQLREYRLTSGGLSLEDAPADPQEAETTRTKRASMRKVDKEGDHAKK